MHWTYEPREQFKSDQLFQGDILRPTEALTTLLNEVHPHFTDPKYSRFIVLTQSCDLVRRGKGACKAPYLTVAVVRDAVDAIEAELHQLVRSRVGQALCDGRYVTEKIRQRFVQIAESLLNNNLPDYFFLKSDIDSGIDTDLCAFLRVSIALRPIHYETLLAAKVAQLREVFQAKLGWLVGYNYARVGTPDWEQSQALFKELVRSFVDNACDWVPDDRFKAITKRLKEEQSQDPSESVVQELLKDDSIMPKPRKELIIDAVTEAWGEGEGPRSKEKFLNRLRQTQPFRKAAQQ